MHRESRAHLLQPPLLKVAHHITARRALDLAVDVVPRLTRLLGDVIRQARVVPVPTEDALAAVEEAVLGRVVAPCSTRAARLPCLICSGQSGAATPAVTRGRGIDLSTGNASPRDTAGSAATTAASTEKNKPENTVPPGEVLIDEIGVGLTFLRVTTVTSAPCWRGSNSNDLESPRSQERHTVASRLVPTAVSIRDRSVPVNCIFSRSVGDANEC